jgi:translation initiation factor IF-3
LAEKIYINNSIRAKELRVLGEGGANLGIMSLSEALKHAREAGLDLLEISPKANPPVAKITDYGRFQYEQKKKDKEIKARSHVIETKVVQIKIGTGEGDLNFKAKRVSEWLKQGHRVKVDLFLFGRYRYMEFNFLKEKLEKFLTLVTEEYKTADPIKKSPKGLSTTIERGKI